MRPLPPLILRLLRPIRRFTLKEPKPAAEAPTVPTQKFFAAFEAVSTAGLSPACIGVSIFVEGPTKCAGSSRCPPIHAQHYGALRGHSRLPPVAPSRQRAWPNTRGLGDAWSKNPSSVGPLFADLTKLASYAPDQFRALVPNVEVLLGQTMPIQKPSISARGALKTEVSGWLEVNPNVVVTLYEGHSKADALGAFEAAASAMQSACNGIAVKQSRWTNAKTGVPTFVVDRLSKPRTFKAFQ